MNSLKALEVRYNLDFAIDTEAPYNLDFARDTEAPYNLGSEEVVL
jgi:hypothetical protein